MNWLKLLVLSAGILLTSCDNGSARKTDLDKPNLSTPSASNKTRELYTKNCAVCHQPDGEGGTVKLEGQKLKVPSLKSGRALKHSDESMIDQILKGGDGMPAFKEKLKQEEIRDLLRFIREDLQGDARRAQD